jgi:hypothetical protein
MSDGFTWLAPDDLGYSDCKMGSTFVGFVVARHKDGSFNAFARSFGQNCNLNIGRFYTESDARAALEAAAIKARKERPMTDTSKEAIAALVKRIDNVQDDASFYGADQRFVVELAEEAAAAIRALIGDSQPRKDGV